MLVVTVMMRIDDDHGDCDDHDDYDILWLWLGHNPMPSMTEFFLWIMNRWNMIKLY
jgi:hypothetical protein